MVFVPSSLPGCSNWKIPHLSGCLQQEDLPGTSHPLRKDIFRSKITCCVPTGLIHKIGVAFIAEDRPHRIRNEIYESYFFTCLSKFRHREKCALRKFQLISRCQSRMKDNCQGIIRDISLRMRPLRSKIKTSICSGHGIFANNFLFRNISIGIANSRTLCSL